MHPYAYKERGRKGGGREIWCGSEPIICTNLFGLIDATAARFVSSFWLPHKVAALWRAKKSIKHFNFSSCFSRREPSKKRRNLDNKGYRGNNGNLPVVFIKCSFRFQFSVFSFFLFCPEKVKVLPAHCPFQCPLILAYYYHTSCSSPPLSVLSPALAARSRATFFHSRDNRIELSSVSVDIERIVPRGRGGELPLQLSTFLVEHDPDSDPDLDLFSPQTMH